MKKFLPVVIGLSILLGGCSIIPSSWHPFGTPLSSLEKKERKEDIGRDKVYEAARVAVHKTQDALVMAPESRAVEVARDFNSEAVALLDQARGAAILSDLTRWETQVSQLCSEDAGIRSKADLFRSKERAQVVEISDLLSLETKARIKAEAKAQDYAVIKERQANILLKAGWFFGIVAFLWILSQVLTVGAHFVPALSPVAGLINGIAAPAVQYAYQRVKSGLAGVGSAMAEIRRDLPEAAAKVVSILDSHTDQEHQKLIAAAARA